MPIYAYRCDACGHTKDALQKMSDPPLVDCPVCGQPALKKQVTAAGFQLKGSGWYVTDFREGQKAKPSNADSATAAVAPPVAGETVKDVAKDSAKDSSKDSSATPAPASAPQAAPAPSTSAAPAAKP